MDDIAQPPDQSIRQLSLIHDVPLLVPALAMIAGISVNRYVWQGETGVWMTLVLLCVLVSLVRPLRFASFVFACVALGGLWHQIRYWDVGQGEFGHPDRWPAWVRGVIVEDAVYRPGGEWPGHPGFTRTVLEVQLRRDNEGWRKSSGRLLISIPGDRSDLDVGDPVEATGMLSAIEGPLNPGEADLRTFWRSQAVWSRLQVDVPEGIVACTDGGISVSRWLRWLGSARRWSRDRLTSALEPRVTPVALALLLGRRDAIDPDLNDAFARTGTTHLLAISGLHLQALALLLWWVFRSIGIPRRPGLILVGLASIGYSALVGFAPSVVRSLVMTLMVCLSALRYREVDRIQIFAGAALLTILFNPSNVFDVGCQLSFLAVGAIAWAVPPAVEEIRRLLGLDRTERVLVRSYRSAWVELIQSLAWSVFEGLVVSVLVWFIAWPMVAWRFHMSSPLGILLNLPLIPLTTVALFASAFTLILSGIWMPLTVPSAFVTAKCLGGTAELVLWGANQSWGTFFVAGPPIWWVLGFYALLGIGWWAWQERWTSRRWTWLLLAAWWLAWPLGDVRSQGSSIRFLAVGHGLAVVIQSEGRAVLYDGGRMGDSTVGRRVIAPALWDEGIRRLDAVFLSHSDSDHFSGIPDVLERIPTAVVYVPTEFSRGGDPAATEMLQAIRDRRVPIRVFDAGDSFQLSPSTRIDAIHPPKDWTEGSKDNERSMVLDVDVSGHHALLTGDLEGIGLQRLLMTEPPPKPYEILLAPHHGARAANPPTLIAWARPSVVIASQKPPIGLPPDFARRRVIDSDIDVKDALSTAVGRSATLIRTWRRGEATMSWVDDQLRIKHFADPALEPKQSTDPKGRHVLNLYAIASSSALWSPWVITALGLLLGLAMALLIFVVEWGAWALVSPKRKLTLAKPELGPGRAINITVEDGVRLVGTWYPAETKPARSLLMLHGLGEDRSSLRDRAEVFHRQGWNVAILDGRGFGESGGATVAFGGLEADDLKRWLDHLIAQESIAPQVAVWGRSMGATIALRSSSTDPRIQALILEAPYADLKRTLARILSRYRLPAVNLLSGLILGKAKKLARVPLHFPSPLDFAAWTQTPALILRGAEDRLVSGQEAEKLAGAFALPTEVYEVAGAGHSNVFEVGGEPLVERVLAFLNAHLPKT